MDVSSYKLQLSFFVCLATTIVNRDPSAEIGMVLPLVGNEYVVCLPRKAVSPVGDLAVSGQPSRTVDLPGQSRFSKEPCRQMFKSYAVNFIKDLDAKFCLDYVAAFVT